MKTLDEKEKKLDSALHKLKSLNLNYTDIKEDFDNLSKQKNQLEIEKGEIKNKYLELIEEHNKLKIALDALGKKEKREKNKENEFSEKIDELNQETDTLLDEIDKWQM